jgi:uncharacterized membrane protein
MAAAPTRDRLGSIDLLRGAVMVLMALDHVRDFVSSATFDPTDLDKTTPALFFTRWITHFCAPVFVALAGLGAHLQGERGKSKGALSRFLLTRGLWLVVLEHTFVRFGWAYNMTYNMMVAQVIWALGWSMVVLAGLVYLPRPVVAAVAIAGIVGHNALDAVHSKTLGAWAPVWTLLHEQAPIFLPGRRVFFVPWVFVMAAGWALGGWLLAGSEVERSRRLLRVGAGMLAAFVLLRATGLYGDPRPFVAQGTLGRNIMAFLNCQKYPPSLGYLLMTLGPATLCLGMLNRATGVVARALEVFGRVPLFYYLWHLVLIHAVAIALATVRYGQVPLSMFNPPFGWKVPAGYGYSLGVVYLVWIAVVLALYPACAWFARLKARNKSPWLSYL